MAKNNLQELEAVVKRFLDKVPLDRKAEVERHHFRLAEFCNPQGDVYKHYGPWAGVYYLYSDDGVVHCVGEGISLKYGLGYRVLENAAKFKLIEKPAMNVGLIFLAEPDLPFALALELFLIRDLRPRCNKLGISEAGLK